MILLFVENGRQIFVNMHIDSRNTPYQNELTTTFITGLDSHSIQFFTDSIGLQVCKIKTFIFIKNLHSNIVLAKESYPSSPSVRPEMVHAVRRILSSDKHIITMMSVSNRYWGRHDRRSFPLQNWER